MNNDIYFTRKYGLVNELIENGEAVFFELKSRYGHITHSTIKREIPNTVDGEKYYDLITPYGYGGPIIHHSTDQRKLVEHFDETFSNFCRRNNIVSEFVRFNPLHQNQEPLQDIYDVQYVRNTVGTDLRRFEDPFKEEFCSTARRKTRKLLRDERFSCVLDKGFGKMDAFIDIYEETMARTNASGFYYFERDYFNSLKKNFSEEILTTSVYFEDEIVAMGLYFTSGETIHDHLNGTKDDFLAYSPAYLLKYTMMDWARDNGFSVIHYGGGISNDPEDSVLKFKKRFSKNTEFEFHIGRKVWHPSIYRRLCLEKGIAEDNEFFPGYRAVDVQIQQKQA